MIRIKVPTLYQGAYVLPKKRTEETVKLLGDVTIGLREVSSEEAPVAHVISDRTPDSEPPLKRYNPFRSGADVRSHEGRFFAARWTVEEFAEAASGSGPNAPFNGLYTSGTDHHGHDRHVLMGMDGITEQLYTSRADVEAKTGTLRKWIDRYDDTAAAMARRAEDFIVVDGRVHELIGEPIIQVERFGNLVTVNVGQARQPDTPFSRGSSDFSRGYTFGIDQLDRALEVAGMVADAPSHIQNNVSVDMVSPWAVRHRGEPYMIRNIAQITINIVGDMLSRVPAQAGLAWHDLATAYEENDGVTPTLIEALRRFHAAMTLNPRNESGFSTADLCKADAYDNAKLDEIIPLVLAIWDGRDDAGIEWIERAADVPPTYVGDLMARELLSLEEADIAGMAIGRPLDTLADEASAGRGRLILVEDAKGPTVAALVAMDGPRILETVTRHGNEPSDHIRDAIIAHASGFPRKEADITMELDELGL